MKKCHLTLLIVFSILLLTSGNVFAAGGNMGGSTQDGSADFPYLIEDLVDFDAFASDANYWDDCIRLETDITLTGRTYNTAIIAADTNNANITFEGTAFTGSFDGNDNVISNLTIDTNGIGNSYLGLFGKIDSSTTSIKNLGMENVNIIGGGSSPSPYNYSSFYNGGLCGYNSSGTISNCYSSGSVYVEDHSYHTGGLCGCNEGKIVDCYTTGKVTGGDDSRSLGGLCGYNKYGTITNCYSSSEVSGNFRVGGLCGRSVTPYEINNCYSTGSVTGNSSVGGFCGDVSLSRINKCYATGDVTGTMTSPSYIGGFCGYNYRSLITNCYCVGNVSVDVMPTYLGGFCGYNEVHTDSAITNCFWNIETAGNDWPDVNSWGAMGKTTLEMQTKSTFTDAGWDFNGYLNKRQGWYMPENSYPMLCWQNKNLVIVPDVGGMTLSQAQAVLTASGFSLGDVYYVKSRQTPIDIVAGISASFGSYIDITSAILDIYISTGSNGDGSQENPYEIACQADLDAVNNDPCANYIMTSDIYMSYNIAYTTAVIAPDTSTISGFQGTAFRGVFDGKGYSVINLTIDTADEMRDYLGLFGLINDPNAEIKNLRVENYNIISWRSAEYIGGLCGSNYYGSIKNCHTAGNINGYIKLGGLCGESSYCNISNCYTTGTIIGSSTLGGLCGYNRNVSISNCYSTSAVTGRDDCDYLGGLCGYDRDVNISNCYATGKITSGDVSHYLGGLCGLNDSSSMNNCFWDMDTTGTANGVGYSIPDPNGVEGKTTIEMQTISTFTDAGWDFVGEGINGSDDVWRMCVDGVSYPKLCWEFATGDFACGDGVDFVDFAVLSDSWNLSAGEINYNEKCDLADDDIINFADLALFVSHWLEGYE